MEGRGRTLAQIFVVVVLAGACMVLAALPSASRSGAGLSFTEDTELGPERIHVILEAPGLSVTNSPSVGVPAGGSIASQGPASPPPSPPKGMRAAGLTIHSSSPPAASGHDIRDRTQAHRERIRERLDR